MSEKESIDAMAETIRTSTTPWNLILEVQKNNDMLNSEKVIEAFSIRADDILEAIKEIKRHSGTQFDPQVIRAFLQLTKRKSFKKLLKVIHHG